MDLKTETYPSIYTVSVKTMEGATTTLQDYEGKVLLIVNVASRCGFTPQYSELESLYRQYKIQGFEVLGFPCDQFLHQEPGTNEEIKAFADQCFQISFPLFAKIDVKGKEQAPLYAYISKNINKKSWPLIPWNFTKVLVDSQGQILKRYLPTTSFKKIRNDLASLLSAVIQHPKA